MLLHLFLPTTTISPFPYLLEHEGKPDTSSIKRRDNNQGGTDGDLKHDYVYSEGDGVICESFTGPMSITLIRYPCANPNFCSIDYKASSLTFSLGPMQSNSTNALQARGRTSDYTINIIISKHTKANTIASTKCTSQLLKYHLDASSEKGRFSCRPLDNEGSWRATMHLMINKGKNNRGTYGK